MDAGGKR